jgi:hypothetical protein
VATFIGDFDRAIIGKRTFLPRRDGLLKWGRRNAELEQGSCKQKQLLE